MFSEKKHISSPIRHLGEEQAPAFTLRVCCLWPTCGSAATLGSQVAVAHSQTMAWPMLAAIWPGGRGMMRFGGGDKPVGLRSDLTFPGPKHRLGLFPRYGGAVGGSCSPRRSPLWLVATGRCCSVARRLLCVGRKPRGSAAWAVGSEKSGQGHGRGTEHLPSAPGGSVARVFAR